MQRRCAFPYALGLTLIVVAAAAGQTINSNPKQRRSGFPGERMTSEQKRALAAYAPGTVIEYTADEVPAHILGGLGPRQYPADPAAEAAAALQRHAAAFRVGPHDSFVPGEIETDNDGFAHVRMGQRYKDVPVIGGELVVHLDHLNVTGISGRYVPDLDVNVDSRQPAEVLVIDDYGEARLAIPVQQTGGTGEEQLTFIDPRSGVSVSAEAAGKARNSAVTQPVQNNRLSNPGFESGTANWTGAAACASPCSLPIYSESSPRNARSGRYFAMLNGRGRTNTEWVGQNVYIGSDAVTANLTFWLKIKTYEAGLTPYDSLAVEVASADGSTVLATLATLSNVNAKDYGAYKAVSLNFNPAAFRGKTVRVRFTGREDSSLATFFYIDDTSLTIGGL